MWSRNVLKHYEFCHYLFICFWWLLIKFSWCIETPLIWNWMEIRMIEILVQKKIDTYKSTEMILLQHKDGITECFTRNKPFARKYMYIYTNKSKVWNNFTIHAVTEIPTTKIVEFVCMSCHAFQSAFEVRRWNLAWGRERALEVHGQLFDMTPSKVKGHPEVYLP